MKGTPSMGKKNKKSHIPCRRCGKHAYHVRKQHCAACGFGTSPRIVRWNWRWKATLGRGNRTV